MSDIRARKIANVAEFIPEQEIDGPESGDLLVLSWGGTFGSCRTAVRQAQEDGKSVTHAHLRYLNPFPRNLETIIRNFKKVLIPELNLGQLSLMIRSKYLVDAVSYNKIQGKPFKVVEVLNKINDVLKS